MKGAGRWDRKGGGGGRISYLYELNKECSSLRQPKPDITDLQHT